MRNELERLAARKARPTERFSTVARRQAEQRASLFRTRGLPQRSTNGCLEGIGKRALEPAAIRGGGRRVSTNPGTRLLESHALAQSRFDLPRLEASRCGRARV